MNGIFGKKGASCLLSAFMLVVGSYIAVRFFSMMLNMQGAENVADLILGFGFGTFGIVMGLLGIFIARLSWRRFLCADDKTVTVCDGIGKRITIQYSELRNINTAGNDLLLCTTNGRCIQVAGLLNFREACAFLRARLPERLYSVHVEKERLKQKKRDLIVKLAMTVAALMLILLCICLGVVLTGGKETHDFSDRETAYFVMCFTAAVFMIVAAIFFADKAGKAKMAYDCAKHDFSVALSREKRAVGLDKYPERFEVKYLKDEPYRLILYCNNSEKSNEEIYFYVLESFNSKRSAWEVGHAAYGTYATYAELIEYISFAFSNERFEE